MPAPSSSASSSMDMEQDGSSGLCREDRGQRKVAQMDRAPAAAPELGDDWVALAPAHLPVAAVSAWVVRPDCGATVTFTGTARDHAPGRPGVHRLEYEAYEEPATARLHALLAELRVRWPSLGRVALLHRVGVVELEDAAVVVAVSAPHRAEAFEAARFAIDELKRSVPIWKREAWAGGESWGLEAQHITEISGTTA
jgi:molybdopterin synthase catalytic subunit